MKTKQTHNHNRVLPSCMSLLFFSIRGLVLSFLRDLLVNIFNIFNSSFKVWMLMLIARCCDFVVRHVPALLSLCESQALWSFIRLTEPLWWDKGFFPSALYFHFPLELDPVCDVKVVASCWEEPQHKYYYYYNHYYYIII